MWEVLGLDTTLSLTLALNRVHHLFIHINSFGGEVVQALQIHMIIALQKFIEILLVRWLIHNTE